MLSKGKLSTIAFLPSDPDLAVSSAQQPKDDGIVIISLWINTNVTKEQLESVATSKRHVVIAHSSRDYTAMSNLVSLICEGKKQKLYSSEFLRFFLHEFISTLETRWLNCNNNKKKNWSSSSLTNN